MTAEAFRSYVEQQSAKAFRHLELAKAAVSQKNPGQFRVELREFVLLKFLLDRDAASLETDNLLRLSDLSTKKILTLTGGNLRAADISFGCTGVDTPETKKIILLLAIREEFRLPIPPESFAEIETIDYLCDRCVDLLMDEGQ